MSEAIARGDVNAINYFVALKYVEAFAKLADSPQQKTVIVPAEMSALVGALGGIQELVSGIRRPGPDGGGGGPAPRRSPQPPPPVQPPSSAVPRST